MCFRDNSAVCLSTLFRGIVYWLGLIVGVRQLFGRLAVVSFTGL